ncbi:MAG: helix-turn-helix domain-containing protein [Chitinophagales bacterium]|nr:helix-turn-helix domain-containing protein [Chitinophagales bacterium]
MLLHNHLKRSRKKSKLTIQDIAFLLDYDVSNLSKYERAVKSVPLHISLGYHIISNEPLFKYFQTDIFSLADRISRKVVQLMGQLEDEIQTKKVQMRVEALEDILRSIGCLKALNTPDTYDGEEFDEE